MMTSSHLRAVPGQSRGACPLVSPGTHTFAKKVASMRRRRPLAPRARRYADGTHHKPGVAGPLAFACQHSRRKSCKKGHATHDHFIVLSDCNQFFSLAAAGVYPQILTDANRRSTAGQVPPGREAGWSTPFRWFPDSILLRQYAQGPTFGRKGTFPLGASGRGHVPHAFLPILNRGNHVTVTYT